MPQSGFTPIITYNTATASAAPSAANLTQGELAVNVTDKKLFTKDSSAAVVQVGSGPSAIDTLSNKTIALGSNTVSGTTAQFNTALTDGDFATLAGTETLTNKTLTNPTYSGTTADGGTVTTIDINGGTIDGTVIGGSSAAAGSFTTLSATGTIRSESGYDTYNATGGTWSNYVNADGSMRWYKGGDRLTLDASGNLSVTGAVSASGIVSGYAGTFPVGVFAATDFRNGMLIDNTNNKISFRADNGDGRATIDASGNLSVTGAVGASGNLSSTSGMIVDKDGADAVASGPFYAVRNSAATRQWITQMGASNELMWYHLNGSWDKKATLDASGNLGLGVTPSGWGGKKALEVSIYSGLYSSAGGDAGLVSNAYYNGTNWIYKTGTNIANKYEYGVDGGHRWYTAPSGTAGNPISFTQAMTLDASGNLLVGTSTFGLSNTNSAIIQTQGGTCTAIWQHDNVNISGTAYEVYVYNGSQIGSITQSGTTAVLYNTTSDQRLKENIVDAPAASDLIDAIQVRSFDWKSDGSHQRYGMVAQELFEVAPEAVHAPADPDEMMAVDYSKLVPMLVKEIQSLRARVAQLEG